MKKKVLITCLLTCSIFIFIFILIDFNSFICALIVHILSMIISSITLLLWIKKEIEKQKNKYIYALLCTSINIFMAISLYYLTLPILWSIFGNMSLHVAYGHVFSSINLTSYLFGSIISLTTSLLIYTFK